MDHVTRPKAVVLPESARIPEENLVEPPALMTHEVVAAQPYFYTDPRPGAAPAGEFQAGTKVAILGHNTGDLCRVVTGQGLKAVTAAAGLRPST